MLMNRVREVTALSCEASETMSMQGRRKGRKRWSCLQMDVFRFGRVRMGSYEAFFQLFAGTRET